MNEVNSIQEQNINLLVIGATGVGKSSTVNALFNTNTIKKKDIATIGYGVSPQTQYIKAYSLAKLTIWDTPGFGDSLNDTNFASEVEKLLQTKMENGFGLIDMAIVILDGSSKDIGTSIDIINNILIPNFGKEAQSRILVAINKIDLIKGGRYWDYKENRPLHYLEEYLNTLTSDIKSRIHDVTNIEIEPIIYSAGNISQKQHPYNLLNFINHILTNLPNEKRIIVAKLSNTNGKNWKYNQNTKEAESTIRKLLREGLRTAIFAGISSLFGGIFFFDV